MPLNRFPSEAYFMAKVSKDFMKWKEFFSIVDWLKMEKEKVERLSSMSSQVNCNWHSLKITLNVSGALRSTFVAISYTNGVDKNAF